MLSRMRLIDKSVGVVVVKDGQGLITIDDFAHLNEKFIEGLCRILIGPGGITWVVTNPGVAVSAMAEANPQGMIYYIKHFKRIGRTCTHTDVEISKVRKMYHHWDMEESHNNPKVVPTVNPRDWTKTLETVEE